MNAIRARIRQIHVPAMHTIGTVVYEEAETGNVRTTYVEHRGARYAAEAAAEAREMGMDTVLHFDDTLGTLLLEGVELVEPLAGLEA